MQMIFRTKCLLLIQSFCVHIDIFFFQIYILIYTVGDFQNQPSLVVSIFLCTHFYSFLSNVYILIHVNDFQNQSSLVVWVFLCTYWYCSFGYTVDDLQNQLVDITLFRHTVKKYCTDGSIIHVNDFQNQSSLVVWVFLCTYWYCSFGYTVDDLQNQLVDITLFRHTVKKYCTDGSIIHVNDFQNQSSLVVWVFLCTYW